MRYFQTTAAVLLVFACAGSAQAQNPFALDIRGGASLPTEDLGTTGLDAGAAFSFAASARVMPHASVYAGWGWNRMSTEVALASADSHIEDTGYAAGLAFQHPMLNAIDGWVRVGGIYNHIELEAEDGDLVADSGHELGWEAGAGFAIPLGQRFAVTPGVRYRTFSAQLDLGDGRMDVDLSYVVIDVGMSYAFGRRPVRTALR